MANIRIGFETRSDLDDFINKWFQTMDHLGAWNPIRPGSTGNSKEEGVLHVPLNGTRYDGHFSLGVNKGDGMESISMSSGAKYFLALTRCPEAFIQRVKDFAYACNAQIA